jgi:iron complex transport system permease protein
MSGAAVAAPRMRTARVRRYGRPVLCGLGVFLAVSAFFALAVGAMPISPGQVASILSSKLGIGLPWSFDAAQESILFTIRLPRICFAVLVGAALGMAGAALQGIFRNPLADPGLIGVSSGAALGAAAVIVFAHGLPAGLSGLIPYLQPAAAFGAGLGVTVLVFVLSLRDGQPVVATMLLAGVAFNSFAAALTGLLTFIAADEQLRSLVFWMLGSLGAANWRNVAIVTPFVIVAVLFLPRTAAALNAMLLGDGEAEHLGFRPAVVRRTIILLSAMAVGGTVAFAGVIGFVGLVVPHLIRLAFGPDHRVLLPASALLGAALMVFADSLARTLVAPAELPIGILTAGVGAPFFMWLLLRERAGWRL